MRICLKYKSLVCIPPILKHVFLIISDNLVVDVALRRLTVDIYGTRFHYHYLFCIKYSTISFSVNKFFRFSKKGY